MTQDYGRDLQRCDFSYVRLPYGTNQRLQTTHQGQKLQKGYFEKDRQTWCPFFKALAGTQSVLNSSHLRVPGGPISDTWDFKGAVKSVKKIFFFSFLRDSSLDTLFSMLCGRLKVFRTLYMSEYLFELIKDNRNCNGAVRNTKNSKSTPKHSKGQFSKKRAVLTNFFRLWERLTVLLIPHTFGYLI